MIDLIFIFLWFIEVILFIFAIIYFFIIKKNYEITRIIILGILLIAVFIQTITIFLP